MLSAGAGMAEFENVLRFAYRAGASGYLAGRAIWSEPFRRFPDWEAIRAGLRSQSAPYMARINALTERAATPWSAHPRFGGQANIAWPDASFRHRYRGF
jgi:tagatose 1,6-diphosphate aldolase